MLWLETATDEVWLGTAFQQLAGEGNHSKGGGAASFKSSPFLGGE